jgi:predicted transcriptional regulator
MQDLQLEVPATEEVEVDDVTPAAIDRSIEAADRGRTVSLADARKMIPKWITKFESQSPR